MVKRRGRAALELEADDLVVDDVVVAGADAAAVGPVAQRRVDAPASAVR